ncbi:hypothetical protein MGG_07917 [Pyricularia oryzae 70-15]|uniref:Uncharacterized protein n=1 Tax=Pyricularia oryzae (strain 70-15 / ATCC MYA-4617 / FGSC 8958) TaxID=242507 RepID=G4N2E7_PYRO7|nr:uncharacterized protein MGG_07917 [Pyricularia oryzae 70-15]EHA53352.1 hypothetical protein MGG_07917 [Pyricularia oryzae 70-15]
MAETVGLICSCLELTGHVFEVAKQVKLIKNAPKDIRQKHKEIAERASKIMCIMQILEKSGIHAKSILLSSQPLLDSIHEAKELLERVFPRGQERKWELVRGGIKAVWDKEEIKEALDKVHQEQMVWLGGLPAHLHVQVIEKLDKVSEGHIRAEALGVETLASTARIESAVAGAQEFVEQAKKEFMDEMRLLRQQFYNQAAVDINQKVPANTITNSNVNESTAVVLAANKRALDNLDSKDCNCVRLLTRRAIMKASIVSQSLYQHRQDCPYYESGDMRQTYCAYLPSWSVCWLPGLRGKYVTVGWDHRFKGGAFSTYPILRITRQIRRGDSPVFKVLDQFSASFPWAMWAWKTEFPEIHQRVAKPEDLEASIDRIKSFFRTGKGFPTDVDENGQSIWQASLMIFKAALIGEHSELIPSLRELLLTLLESGVQPDQEYRGSDYLTLKSIWRWPIDQATYEFFDGKTTALDGFRLPLYDELKAAKYIEDDAKFDSIFEKIPPMAWRPLLRAHPELLDDYGLTPIAQRLLLTSTVEKFKDSVTCKSLRDWDRENNWWHKRVLLGWPEIIPYIAQAGCSLPIALEDACLTGCVEIVRALLRVEYLPIRTVHLDNAFNCGSSRVLETVVQEMMARREMVCELASAVLQPDVLEGFGLCVPGRAPSPRDARRLLEITLDEYQGQLAKALRNLGSSTAYFMIDSEFRDEQTDEFAMVERLSCINLFEEYTFLDPASCNLGGDYAGAIQCLLDAGFHDLDREDDNKQTVLYKTCHNYKPEGAEFGVDDRDLLWLLKHSKKNQFPLELASEHQSLVSPIFYAASALRHVSIEALKDAGVLEQLSEVPTDCCECFCSSNGCMPHYMFLRCDGNGCQEGAKHDACTGDAYGVTGRDGCLHQWCEAWALPDHQMELYYAEACRLEVFERLGMKHTCCASGRRKDYLDRIRGLEGIRSRFDDYQTERPRVNIPNRWPRADDSERQEFQEEDAELNADLERVMHYYDKMRAPFLTSPVCGEADEDFCDSFWFLWWSCVDRILPPLGKEKCVYRGIEFSRREIYKERGVYEKMDEEFADKREDEREAALSAAGYEGLDFRDVVDEYFGESLDAIVFLRSWRAN